MSKYEELCDIYATHRESMKAYQESAVSFAEAFVASLSDYFSLRPDIISFRDEQNRRFHGHPRPYVRLMQDSYFHLRFGIKLEEGPKVFPKEDFIQDIRFKKMKPQAPLWVLEMPQGGKFTLDISQGNAAFAQVHDQLFKLISDFYRYYLDQFLSPEPNVAPIGFKTEPLKQE